MSFTRKVVAKSVRPTGSGPQPSCRSRYLPRLEVLEDRLVPAVHTWDGSASALWNNAANWQENVAPVAGEVNLQLVFPGGAANLGNTNNIVGLTVQAITISGTGYTMQGNDIALKGGITASQDALVQFNINLAAVQTFTVTGAGSDLNLSGIVSGVAGANLTKAGTATLILSGANTYAGATAVNAGILKILNVSALGTPAAGTAVAEGATLQLQLANGTVANEVLTLKGKGVGNLGALENVSGNNTWSGPITLTATAANPSAFIGVDVGGQTLALTGILKGTGGFTKVGLGNLDLAGTVANTYAGVTRVNEGFLRLNNTTGVTAIPHALVVGDGVGAALSEGVTLLQANQIANNATATVNASGLFNPNNLSETIGALILTGGSVQTGTGTLTLSGNVTTTASVQQAQISGKLDLGGATRTFTIADDAATVLDLSINAVISNGALTKAGAGTLFLGAANNYAGLTRVNAGNLAIGVAGTLGTPAAGTVVAKGATLLMSGSVSAEALTLSGKGVNNAGALQNISSTSNISWGGPIILTATLANPNVSIGVNGAADSLTLTGLLSGTAGLTKVGVGPLIMNGSVANTYAGVTRVNEGTLRLNNSAGNAVPHGLVVGDGLGGPSADEVQVAASNQIADNAAVSVTASGLFNWTNPVLETIGALNLTTPGDVVTSSGTLTITGNVTVIASASVDTSNIEGNLDLGGTTRNFTVGNGVASTELFIGANISNGALTKAGTGTLELIGSNSYAGLTRVKAGVLEAGAPLALGTTAAGTVVSAGATLALNDTVTGESLTLSGKGVANLGALQSASFGLWDGPITLAATVASLSVFMGGDGVLQVNGIISGNAGLTKVGLGTLLLSGSSSNNYAGATRVNSGSLNLNKTGGATAIPHNLIVGDGLGGLQADIVAWVGDEQIANGATLTLKSSGVLQVNSHLETIHFLIMAGGAMQNVASLTAV